MADLKISGLTAYTPALDTDVIPIVDVTTATTKKITKANFLLTIPSATTATTQAANDNSTKLATTAYVDGASKGFPYGCKVHMVNGSANQTVATGTQSVVKLDTKDWDFSTEFNTTTNRYVASTAGYYIVTANIEWNTTVDTYYYELAIFVNGVPVGRTNSLVGGTNQLNQNFSTIIHLNVSDYVQVAEYQETGVNRDILYGKDTNMSIQRIY